METITIKSDHEIALEALDTMVKDSGWFISPGDRLYPQIDSDESVGVEFFDSQTALTPVKSELVQGVIPINTIPHFNPANITIENGIYYASIYVCEIYKDSTLEQRVALWFGSLKETDHVKLTVCAKLTNIPFACLITILGAIANTKAKVEILLDQIVIDGLAYFYLLAEKVKPMHCGALFIPSYVDSRAEDTSTPWKAVHDFYTWIVERAVELGRLTSEEGDRLNRGEHVVVPNGRFPVE